MATQGIAAAAFLLWPAVLPVPKMAAATALDIAELPFSDLVVLLSPETPADDGRFRRVVDAVVTELGRGGSGLLAIAGVPRVGALRRRLLPLARRLALMDHPIRSQLLKVPLPLPFPSSRC